MSRPRHPHPRPSLPPSTSSTTKRSIVIPAPFPLAGPPPLFLAAHIVQRGTRAGGSGVPEYVEALEERVEGDFKGWGVIVWGSVGEGLEEVGGDVGYGWGVSLRWKQGWKELKGEGGEGKVDGPDRVLTSSTVISNPSLDITMTAFYGINYGSPGYCGAGS